ncbi:MAG: hypothetical protein RBS28_10320 [Rhodocyclaceae bacterium]|jgi:hypothetical protein|nr:hypothetical protein [Rhodocyclaceae bacterium]
MLRPVSALIGMAMAFAALAFWLGLHRYGNIYGVSIGILVCGYPTLFFCCKRRYWEAWRMALLGGLGGSLCALPFAGSPFAFGFLLFLFVVGGVLAGLLFWLAAIWRNDDLTCPKSYCLPCGTAYRVARQALGRRPAGADIISPPRS